MPTAVRVSVNDSAVAMELSTPPGENWKYLQKLGTEHAWRAAIAAPIRSGTIKRSHNLALTPVGSTGVRASVGNYADHALYVHEGTTGPIFATGGGNLWLRPSPASWFPRGGQAKSVRGQEANPWIAKAAEDVYTQHGFHGPFIASWG